MTIDPLERKTTPRELHRLAQAGNWSPATLERALAVAGCLPDKSDWQRFINTMLLLMGAALALAGIIFFFAYNWAAMGRFIKFAVLEAVLVATVVIAWQRGLQTLSGKVALLAAAVLLGPLLAVYGQTYQTGADPYQLFTGWAALIAGWVCISAFAPLWLLLLVLLNTALILFWGQVLEPGRWSDAGLYEALFLLNGMALAAWELFAARGVRWLTGRWIPQIIACAALLALLIPTMMLIFESGYRAEHAPYLVFAPLLYLVSVAFALWYFRCKSHDLFILAATLLSAIIVATTFIVSILHDGFAMFLPIALLIVAQSVAAAAWLRATAKAWEIEQ